MQSLIDFIENPRLFTETEKKILKYMNPENSNLAISITELRYTHKEMDLMEISYLHAVHEIASTLDENGICSLMKALESPIEESTVKQTFSEAVEIIEIVEQTFSEVVEIIEIMERFHNEINENYGKGID